MKKIRCVRGQDGDWLEKTTTLIGYRWILCDDKSRLWWETTGAKEINITLDTKPCYGAYKCKVPTQNSWAHHLHIQNPETGYWYKYDLYQCLLSEILNLYQNGEEFYMGIEIVK